MSEHGKSGRPGGDLAPPAPRAQEPDAVVLPARAGSPLGANRMAGVEAERAQVADELKFRLSGGREGASPLGRVLAEREQMASDVSRRITVMRKASGSGAGPAKIP